MSDEQPYREPPPPTGFRLRRGTTVLKEWSCPMCPSRGCMCMHFASEESKREAELRGGQLVIETLEGVKLAERIGTRTGAAPVLRRKKARP
jgi:hypothetical protein